MLGIADEIAEQYLSRVKIKEDFISAACPFHGGGKEAHPSFWISRSGGNWGCFTCGASGGDLRWLLKSLKIGGPALEMKLEDAVKQAKKHRERERLKQKAKAKKSFAGEHTLPDAILGVFDYAPLDLLEAGFEKQILKDHDIGFDKRFERITFPIRDLFGNLVGISGRATLVGDEPKYLIYSGRRTIDGRMVDGELGEWYPDYSNEGVRDHLWRMDKCYERIFKDTKKEQQLIVVEGYKAALWLVQHGWINTVALMGARMSRSQERIIRKLGVETFVLLDNNMPGRKGSKKITETLGVSSFPVYDVSYPGRCDEDAQPDDLSFEELEEALVSSKRIGGIKNVRFMGRQY